VIVAAGGNDSGGIGTSFDKISSGITEAQQGRGVVILADLGSAILTAETALDFLDDADQSLVVIADAPIVEGAVAAAVASETGGSLADVVAAARTATGVADAHADEHSLTREEVAGAVERSATLVNPSGLHARPAAEFVKHASKFSSTIQINGVDAKSLLRIMGLGLAQGSTVSILATGPDAAEAVDALISLVDSGFGEL
jgi:PTS hybrid protein